MKKMLTVFYLLLSLSSFAKTPPPNIIYVNKNATGFNDGTSWSNAYTNLQDALSAATSGYQIWVAAGTYYPDEGAGQTNNARSSSFTLKNGIAIYGGFPATGDPIYVNRAWTTNVTILSGDIDQNDPDNGANAWHVVKANDLDSTAILDGFTITAGLADFGDDRIGGGMLNNSASPTIANCSFSGNKAWFGGGIYNENGSSPILTNCSFSGNIGSGHRFGYGGGIYNESSSPNLINCRFSGNAANEYGGYV